MGLQPFNTAQKLYYTSGQIPFGPGIYDVLGLTGVGDRLYSFNVGDYAYPSLTPIPHVEMTLFNLDPNTVNITVYRTAGRRTMPVRGQIQAYAVGGRNVVDWEAPFGIPLTYRAEQFDSTGQSIGFTGTFATQLDVAETWIHNPFEPASGIAVQMLSTAGAALSRPIPTDKYWAGGNGVAVGISSQRRGLNDVACSFATLTEADADTVRDMFGDPYQSPSTPPVLVIRTGAKVNLRFPQPFFALIDDPVETPLDAQQGGHAISWECTATEVAPPAPALVGSVLSYADIDISYPSYGAMDAAYSSYLARDRDYSLAGAADGD